MTQIPSQSLNGPLNPGLLEAIVGRLAEPHRRISEEPAVRVIGPDALARLRARGIPAHGRPLQEVIDELLGEVLPYRARMDHPRFFAFIPSPASPLSWIGDLLTSVHNAHGGSWLQSSAASCVESELIAWLNERIGFPPGAGGLFVSGGSMANLTALTIARDRRLHANERSLGVAYVSDQTHSSVAKGLRIIGFLDRQIRRIPCDDAFRMDAARLSDAIARDRAAGLVPFAVIANAGSTNTGSIDPLPAIADLCEREALWLHVDGAYGASIALSPEHRPQLAGIERADSVSWDAHKWLFQTYGCGAVLVRDRHHLPETFHSRAEYLRDAETGDGELNYWDLGPELTRPTRAIKLWLTLQAAGSEAMGAAVSHGLQLARWAQDEAQRHEDWRIVSPAQLAIVNFRYAPDGFDEATLDAINRGISRRALEDGYAAVLTTQLHGRTVLRICAIHPAATEEDMRETVRRLDGYARLERERWPETAAA